jgi:hypothetical protein
VLFGVPSELRDVRRVGRTRLPNKAGKDQGAFLHHVQLFNLKQIGRLVQELLLKLGSDLMKQWLPIIRVVSGSPDRRNSRAGD